MNKRQKKKLYIKNRDQRILPPITLKIKGVAVKGYETDFQEDIIIIPGVNFHSNIEATIYINNKPVNVKINETYKLNPGDIVSLYPTKLEGKFFNDLQK